MFTNAANLLSSPGYVLSLPIILLVLFAGGILLIDLITPADWKWMNAATAMAGILFSAAGVVRIQLIQEQFERSSRRLQWAFGHSVLIDHLSIYFYYLFLFIAAITILTSVPQVQVRGVRQGKIYALILVSVAGMMLMAAGFDVAIIFVSLELLSVSTFILVGCLARDRSEREASLKYFLRGAFSSALFAGGLSLLYGLTGSTNLQMISQVLKNISNDPLASGKHALLTLAVGTTVAGLCCKIAAMPFHLWMLDLCEGTAASIAGFISLAFQVAGWAMFLRVLLWGMYPLRGEYLPMLIVVALLSIIGVSVTALTQTSLPRLFGYSCVAQGGFILFGMISLLSVQYPAPAFFAGFNGILFYLLAYTLMNLGEFATVALLQTANPPQNRRRGEIENLAGLFYRNPAMAIFMAIFLFSSASLPLSAGFYGKYLIVQSLFASGHYVLAAVVVLVSIVSLYYYGQLAQVIFTRDPNPTPVPTPVAPAIALAVLSFFTLAIGIYPRPFLRAVEWSLQLT